MPETFSPPPRLSDPDMLQGTCVTHVPWCMPGSLTSGFLWTRWRGKRSRHSRRMRNPQFYVPGKKPMTNAWWLVVAGLILLQPLMRQLASDGRCDCLSVSQNWSLYFSLFRRAYFWMSCCDLHWVWFMIEICNGWNTTIFLWIWIWLIRLSVFMNIHLFHCVCYKDIDNDLWLTSTFALEFHHLQLDDI